MFKNSFKKLLGLAIALMLMITTVSCSKAADDSPKEPTTGGQEQEVDKEPEVVVPVKKEILLTFAGDCTLGTDKNFNQATSLPAMLVTQNYDYSYFFKNVKDIFDKDDLTVVNLEGPLTTHDKIYTNKRFNFKGDPELAKTLVEGSIEAVNLSNNHTYDYGEVGLQDTLKALEANSVSYFGAEHKYITELQGISFGFLGYSIWNEDSALKEKIKSDIRDLRSQGAAIIVMNAHWGIEKDYWPNDTQKNMAHFAIDNGVDLVIGHHPHVVQSIEKYNDKYIFYSLANFAFGGNSNPSDKDTMIVQVKYNFTDDKLENYGVKVIPTRVSSVNNKNDYCPTPAIGDEKTRIFKKINDLNINIDFDFDDNFHFAY